MMQFISDTCLVENNIDYSGNDVGVVYWFGDLPQCRTHCRSVAGANYFTYNSAIRYCYCKTSNSGRNHYAGAIAGELNCNKVNTVTGNNTLEHIVVF